MKSDNCIYLYSEHPVFNSENIPEFYNFSKEDSKILYSSFFENNANNLELLKDEFNFVLCIDTNDLQFLPEHFKTFNDIIFTDNISSLPEFFRNMSAKYFDRYKNNLLVPFNVMGLISDEIKKAFNLLSIDDEAIVLGKNNTGHLTYFGFNSYNSSLFDEINWSNLLYDQLLVNLCKHNNFLHVLESNLLVFKNPNDFKTLYTDLSKKESLAYCNDIIHEKFTHLFIEYKDLLK